MRWTTVAGIALTGCLSEAGFPDAVADDLCRRVQQCDADRLRAIYGTDDRCRQELQDQMELFLVQSERLECAWSGERAKDCLDAIDVPSCDELDVADLMAGCAEAWGCAD